jgi:hypothetical protein
LTEINAPKLDEVRLRSHWGYATSAITYLVDIRIGDETLPGMEVVADQHGEHVLIGRDVLNRLMIFIDGPNLSTSLLSRPPRSD